MTTLTLSIILPIHDEQSEIRAFVDRLIYCLKELKVTYEVIAVDDGSKDGTREILQQIAKNNPNDFRLIIHPYNKGNGAAIKSGIRAARGEVIACMDADGQHQPEDLMTLFPYMAEYDLVVGARQISYSGSWHRNIANNFYNAFASWLTNFPVKDLTSGYRLFRATVVRNYVHIFPARFSYPTTSTLLFLKGGYNVCYVPIDAKPRASGKSKINPLIDGWRFIIIILRIIFLYEPLRLFLPLSVLFFLIAILLTILGSLQTGFFRLTNTSVLLFVLSVLVFLIGLVSEQIATIQISVQDSNNKDKQ